MPGYKEVPEHYKAPFGPYRQAPAEYGGFWWFVNPFTGPEPWLVMDRVEKTLPPGFEAIFGKRPTARDYPSPESYRADRTIWEQDLKNYVKPGPPEGISDGAIAEAVVLTKEWGLGDLVFYLDGNAVRGWRAVWLNGPLKQFDLSADFVLQFTHHAIGVYQWAMLVRGLEVKKLHPLVVPSA